MLCGNMASGRERDDALRRASDRSAIDLPEDPFLLLFLSVLSCRVLLQWLFNVFRCGDLQGKENTQGVAKGGVVLRHCQWLVLHVH